MVLITAFGDPETHAEAYRLGADAVLDKPLDVDDLRLVVQTLVSMRGWTPARSWEHSRCHSHHKMTSGWKHVDEQLASTQPMSGARQLTI